MLSVEELNDRLIDLAFAEDIGDGDHTTLCCIPDTEMGESKLLIKQEGIIAAGKEYTRVWNEEIWPTAEAEALKTFLVQNLRETMEEALDEYEREQAEKKAADGSAS